MMCLFPYQPFPSSTSQRPDDLLLRIGKLTGLAFGSIHVLEHIYPSLLAVIELREPFRHYRC